MTRTQAIAAINAKLAALTDERVRTVIDYIDHLTNVDEPIRDLTQREMALVQQSKADFAAGRTLTIDESRTRSNALIERLRARHPTAR